MKIIDQIVDIILLACVVYVAYILFTHFDALPEEIPVHFNAKGDADNYGSKNTVIILAVIGFVVILGLRLVRDRKQDFNYPFPLTERNEEIQYQLARGFLLFIAVITALLFSSLVYGTIAIGMGDWTALPGWLFPTFILTFFGGLLAYGIVAYKNK